MCRHDLLRDGIDAAIPPVRRRQLHRQLVTAIESHVGSEPGGDPRDVAHLAYHAAAAGLARPTIDYSVAAAITAAGAGAHREAASHLMRALDFREAMDAAELDAVLRRAYQRADVDRSIRGRRGCGG